MKHSKGAVACGHQGTAETAVEVLRAGGNAADACIAAFFSACLFEPVLASLGGGGFAMCRMNNQSPSLLDFFTQTPLLKRPPEELDFERVTVDFGGAYQDFHIGLGAAATPGAVRGVFELHRRYASMPMTELIKPALDKARDGVTICDLQGFILKVVEPIYISRQSARDLFASRIEPQRVIRPGETVRFDALCAFIEALAHEGEDLFYCGEVAKVIDAECRNRGGSLRRQDMQQYEAHWREPLTTKFREGRVWLNPPPCAGGVLILFALMLLRSEPALNDPADYYKTLADVMQLTNEMRLAECHDERPWPDIDKLLGESFVDPYLKQLNRRALAFRGTTHISVVDASGSMVGMTVTNGEGCGEITPQTGIMFNNMLGEEDLNPAGFHRWPVNTRMSSMMSPTLIEYNGNTRVMLGSGGSNRIRTALLQVIVQLLDLDQNLVEATLSPRMHLEGDTLNIEGGVPKACIDALKAKYPNINMFDGRNLFFGGVHSVMMRGDTFDGAGDPRRAGVFLTA
ncbi:MAG: gamma-glutamyltranspeptidase [marine bacterium B5-7]|nr:MAG: gamma-glutamyltranspeptidase [marine bacterium B5-7]